MKKFWNYEKCKLTDIIIKYLSDLYFMNNSTILDIHYITTFLKHILDNNNIILLMNNKKRTVNYYIRTELGGFKQFIENYANEYFKITDNKLILL